MITTILFDKDGVFLDSEIINVESHVYAMKDQGIHLDSDDRLDMYGKNGNDGARILSKKYNFDTKKYIILKRSYYREHLHEAEIFSEVVEFAKKLKADGYTLGMVTSMGEKSTEESLKKLKLEDIFDVVITADQCENRKPNPEPYLKAVAALGVRVEDSIVFEDSPVGITAAQDAGMRCVVIKSPHVREEDIANADYILRDKRLLVGGKIDMFL